MSERDPFRLHEIEMPDLSALADEVIDLSNLADEMPDLSALADEVIDLSDIAGELIDFSSLVDASGVQNCPENVLYCPDPTSHRRSSR